jgi:hypothetical protein
MTSEIVLARDWDSIGCLAGISPEGAYWIYDDGSMLESADTCAICDRNVWARFHCLDGGEVVCEQHISFAPSSIVNRLAAEVRESIDSHSRLVRMRSEIGLAAKAVFVDCAQRGDHYLGFVAPEGFTGKTARR